MPGALPQPPSPEAPVPVGYAFASKEYPQPVATGWGHFMLREGLSETLEHLGRNRVESYGSNSMKYTIEIVRHDDDGTRKVLHRFASDANSPVIVKAEATRLLRRRAREANGVRITNHRGLEVYNWRAE